MYILSTKMLSCCTNYQKRKEVLMYFSLIRKIRNILTEPRIRYTRSFKKIKLSWYNIARIGTLHIFMYLHNEYLSFHLVYLFFSMKHLFCFLPYLYLISRFKMYNSHQKRRLNICYYFLFVIAFSKQKSL